MTYLQYRFLKILLLFQDFSRFIQYINVMKCLQPKIHDIQE